MRRRDWLKSIVALTVTAAAAKTVTETLPVVTKQPRAPKTITHERCAVMLGGPMHGRYSPTVGRYPTISVPVRNDCGGFSENHYRICLVSRGRSLDEAWHAWLFCGEGTYPTPEAFAELKRWRPA
jgi:hypothetical protein